MGTIGARAAGATSVEDDEDEALAWALRESLMMAEEGGGSGGGGSGPVPTPPALPPTPSDGLHGLQACASIRSRRPAYPPTGDPPACHPLTRP